MLVRRGAYVPAEVWSASSERDRYLIRMRAFALVSSMRQVFCLESAAALYGADMLGRWPTDLHVLTDRTGGGSSRPGIRRHLLSDSMAVQEIEGLLVTSPARTCGDFAVARPFESAVVTIDSMLRVLPALASADVQSALDGRGDARGIVRASRALEFSNGKSESVLESISRVAIHEMGFPAPVLQKEFRDAQGLIGFADFCWTKDRIIGEADGAIKYLDERFRGGRPADRVVYDEKRREDRMRRVGRGFARWDWAVATDRRSFEKRLTEAGLKRSAA